MAIRLVRVYDRLSDDKGALMWVNGLGSQGWIITRPDKTVPKAHGPVILVK